ncbi:MAG: hypothetical protein WC208_00240 [Gallionella sp.]|jgi:hypothetical protein
MKLLAIPLSQQAGKWLVISWQTTPAKPLVIRGIFVIAGFRPDETTKY